jgi:hypothetical protein
MISATHLQTMTLHLQCFEVIDSWLNSRSKSKLDQLSMISHVHNVTYDIELFEVVVRDMWVAIINMPVKTLHIRVYAEMQQDTTIAHVDMSTAYENTAIRSVKITVIPGLAQSASCRQYMLRCLSKLPLIEELQFDVLESRSNEYDIVFSTTELQEHFHAMRQQLNFLPCGIRNLRNDVYAYSSSGY